MPVFGFRFNQTEQSVKQYITVI